MGILDYISSTCDPIKRNAPNLSSVKHLYWSSYDYSRAAVAKIHNVFTDNAAIEKLNQHLPDEDTRSKIAENLAKNFAAAAVQEGLKFVPGVVYFSYYYFICYFISKNRITYGDDLVPNC
ncbi:hypothetical protein Pint_04437 [Pistacia integerrima]|uniref:Uncharacterized protein n=1 Tax=Pistacia integerrima TaxID=434235 RepID=A0ACC0Z578_9ROSI|nr:hypothetical protein Pint_04437 [Pistacia integerrima]